MKNLGIIVFLLFTTITCGYSQSYAKVQLEKSNKIITKSLINKDYYNKFIIDNTKGEMFMIDSLSSYMIVLVKWKNGYFSIGKVSSGYAYGEWNTYDKKNRLRKRVGFGDKGEMLLYIREFNKKGILTYSSDSSVPF